MASSFLDILYGSFSFSDGEDGSLVNELISTPEVQRLRFLRLLNHDAPSLQELASARRFAHSVGACYVASVLLQRAPWISLQQRKEILAAALIHDIGILPYGHLVERELSRVTPGFNHESLVYRILWGTYHPTNIYHQILTDASLKVAAVLRRFNVDPDRVFTLICPKKGSTSPIAGAIDVDNIDNVHRMAVLVGRLGARRNVRSLLSSIKINNDLELVFEPSALGNVHRWLRYRELIYTYMIAEPSGVAYNAFLQDIARQAVKYDVISPQSWFVNDMDFEAKLLATKELQALTAQLRSGCRYRLLDYTWIELSNQYINRFSRDTEEIFKANLEESPVVGAEHRIWIEVDKVSRLLRLRVNGHHDCLNVGKRSAIVLIGLIDPDQVRQSDFAAFRDSGKQRWRKRIRDLTRDMFPQNDCTFFYPESFPFGGMRRGANQLELFQTTA